MREDALNNLRENEECYRGHLEFFGDTVEELKDIVKKYGGENQKELEKDIVQLIINAR